MKYKHCIYVISSIMGICGAALIIYHANLLVAAGVTLLLWGNNISVLNKKR